LKYQYLLVEKEDGIATIKINRPKALNALNTDLLKEIKDLFSELEDNKDVKVIIITGSGEKAFVAGADIAEMKDKSPVEAKEFAEAGHAAFKQIENTSKPVIAAVNGFALGGGNELALACDIRLAGENARFGQPEVGLGIIAGFGGTQRLPDLVGPAKAKELLFTGDTIKAKEAEQIGLVNQVVSQDNLMETAQKMAFKIASNAPLALKMTKEAVDFGLAEGIEKGLEYETNAFSICFSTGDQKNGMAGFLNKEKVEFKGE
jgi:enoyl-CoA hydratase